MRSSVKAVPADFMAAFFAHVPPVDLRPFSPQAQEAMAASLWNLGETRRLGETKIRVSNPDIAHDGWSVDHTLVEMVADDMPFLIDSLTGTLQAKGLSIHVLIHPVLTLARDAQGKLEGLAQAEGKNTASESVIHIQVDRCPDEAQLADIEKEIRLTLAEVTAAVVDWGPMRARMCATMDSLTPSGRCVDAAEDIEEIRAFLAWLAEDNFTFLGSREIALETTGEDVSAIRIVAGQGLGILRDDERRMFGGLRDLDSRKSPALVKYARRHHVLFMTKTDDVARVHRIVPMDAVFIRSFDAQGIVTGEKLFVGLFTARTYAQTPFDIPFMRRKIAHVVERLNLAPESHDGRALTHILNTYPHDELFQINEDELFANARGILQLQERARVALFRRLDPFGRYVSFLLYVPRDRYDSTLRDRVQAFLGAAHEGDVRAWHVRIDDSLLARAFIIVHLQSDSPRPAPALLEETLRDMCRSWTDRLRDALIDLYGEAQGLALLRRYGESFSYSYQDTVLPVRAAQDISLLESARAQPRLIADLQQEPDGKRLRLKVLQPARALSLSETLPLIEHMGLRVAFMSGPYEVRFKSSDISIFVHEYVGEPAFDLCADFAALKPAFEATFLKVWAGEAEDDGVNALALRVGMGPMEIALLRAFARYLRQLRIPYSHEMMSAALVNAPDLVQKIVTFFKTRHDPAFSGDRAAALHKQETSLKAALERVTSLEDDRILRRYVNLVQASLRTNFFQRQGDGTPKPCLAIKFDSRLVHFMPLPKPLYEIFVYSPRVEALHLRGGKVARGGIRWSDRRDDFRYEVLALMKAQMVKNSVIVPVGSKGGFIVKHPPADSGAFQQEGIACYKLMMNGLLDLTDNRENGAIVPPPDTVRHDGDDPYLVVAADKGTATFSDIANGIARERGFWLDDAFASGGSAGYDHKKMGITARGAWEAIKRHFRESGKNIQETDFTCIGVGDMSGDVFGNGMLLSKHICLLGAFDHRHIFCDPNPDAAISYGERARLFALPRSSWADYDLTLISKGGGIFARSEKSIKISAEMKKAYGLTVDHLAPAELIQALLTAQVELLYFGGIGTYIKAESEAHDVVADRANDSLRVNGSEVRAKIIGEGGNLGMTQRGRVEYALSGGRLNTDAIDNSAGVDTSDHEVNIKILLSPEKELSAEARNTLLAGMTDAVAHLVLRDNYLQTQALTLAEATAPESLIAHAHAMQFLEKTGLLNRAVEFLPDEAEIAERHRQGRGLTRPELAVLLSYVKIWLTPRLLDSDLPDDKALRAAIAAYFPNTLQKSHAVAIERHQLRREIAATVLTNDIVNHTGIRLVAAMAERADPARVVRAYVLAREALGLRALWTEVEHQDEMLPAATQTKLLLSIRAALAGLMDRILAEAVDLKDLDQAITRDRKGLESLTAWIGKHHDPVDSTLHSTETAWVEKQVPRALARRVALLPVLVDAYGLIALSAQTGKEIETLAALYFGFEKRLGFGWLRHPALSAATQTPWQQAALTSVLRDLSAHHNRLTAELAGRKDLDASPALAAWSAQNTARLDPYDALITEGKAGGAPDLALLSLANEALEGLSG